MVSSISNIIPDETTDCALSSDFPGCSIPTSYNSYLTRKPLDQCKLCSKSLSGAHKCWQDVCVKSENLYAYNQDNIGRANNIREKQRQLQALIGLMDRVCVGVQNITEWSNNPISNVYGGWEVVGCGGNTVTLKYVENSDNPNQISWTETTDNPDWGSPGQPKYLNTSYSCGLDVKGILTFSDNSYLAFHGGIITQKYDISKTIQVGDTFTVYTDTPISSYALRHLPNADTGIPIKASIRVYVGPFRENWINIRDFYHVYYSQRTLTIAPPHNQLYVLQSGRIILPQYGQDYFIAQSSTDLMNWSDIGFSTGQLYTEVQDGGSIRSCLDLTTYDLTGIAAIRLQYFGEDSSGSLPFYDRCRNSVHEPSGTYGKWSQDSRRFFCAKAQQVAQHSGGQAYLDRYSYNCCDSRCPYYEPDKFTSITDQNVWQQLSFSHPFKITVAQPNNQISRIGVPSLGSLAGLDLLTYNILETEYHYDWFKGMMPKQCIWSNEDGVSQVHGVGGFESRWMNNAGVGPDMSDVSTLPPYGPGGGNILERKQEYSVPTVNTGNDPYRTLSNQITLSSLDIDRYTFNIVGGHGKFQRFSDAYYQLWFPKIASGTSVQTYPDGTYQRGFWDKDFNKQSAQDQNTVYFGLISITKGMRYSRGGTDAFSGSSKSAIIHSATFTKASLGINLFNGVTTLTCQTGPQLTRQGRIKCAGNNVALPDWARIRNYSSNQNTVGAGRQYIQVGMVAQIEGLPGKYWVTKTVSGPNAGPLDCYNPDATSYDATAESAYYDAQMSGMLGLPANHKTWGNHTDQTFLFDENGVLSKASNLTGKTITYSYSGIFLPGSVTVYLSDPATTDNDSTIAATVFTGSGDVYLKQDVDVGKCVYLSGMIADRQCVPSVTEFNSYLRAYEKLISE